MQWLHEQGGTIQNPKTEVVSKLARMGAAGRHASNCERDLHANINRWGWTVKARISWRDVRVWDPKTLRITETAFPIILPEDLCLAFWKRGEATFRKLLFGGMSAEDARSYWSHVESHCSWFADHPARSWHDKAGLASLTAYGDEVQCFRNSECGVVSVVSWAAELGMKSEPLCRYFLVAAWSEHMECEDTYNDVAGYMAESFKKLSDQRVEWPWTKYGYLLSFTGIQGDLKWLHERCGGLFNWRQNEFCSRCACTKSGPNVWHTLPCFPDDPGAFQPLDLGDLSQYSPLMALDGLRAERLMHDVMHSQYLGTGKTVNGALVCMLRFG